MTLWRDPLDELIEDLERALPAEAGPAQIEPLPPIEGLQLWVHATLYGTPEDLARVERDPRVQANMAYFAKLGQQRAANDERRSDCPQSESEKQSE